MKGWPASPKSLAGQVRRLAPDLRQLGFTVEFSREPGSARRRIIELRPLIDDCVPTVPTVLPDDEPEGPASASDHVASDEQRWWDDRDDRDGCPLADDSTVEDA